MGVSTVTPFVPDFFSKASLTRRPNLAINISKLWLDRLLPEFDLLLWIDADAWVQDVAAIERLFGAAATGTIAIVPEIGAKMTDILAVRWIMPGWMQVRSFLYKSATRARLPFSIRKRIGVKALLNTGVFCLRRDAPHWDMFRKWQKTIIARGGVIFTQDQLAVALTVYIDGAGVTFLDNGHNYLGPWLLDEKSDRLVNLFYPHPPVGIVHLASKEYIRHSLNNTIAVPTVGGGTAMLNLRYGGLERRMSARIRDRLKTETVPEKRERREAMVPLS
ncbi:glycosyl transferase family protein [Gluconacetobacter johannae DSM 13595]|nr:glycosyl transferase family protein [Gluconacetobacter johannae DSM 13595]